MFGHAWQAKPEPLGAHEDGANSALLPLEKLAFDDPHVADAASPQDPSNVVNDVAERIPEREEGPALSAGSVTTSRGNVIRIRRITIVARELL